MITGTSSDRGFSVHIGGVRIIPLGEEWGQGEDRKNNLALAILQHYTSPEFASQNQGTFKHSVVISWPEDFRIRERSVKNWIRKHGYSI